MSIFVCIDPKSKPKKGKPSRIDFNVTPKKASGRLDVKIDEGVISVRAYGAYSSGIVSNVDIDELIEKLLEVREWIRSEE